MVRNVGAQELQLAHGIRGGIPEDRMTAIQAALPRSLELRTLNPCLENPLVGLGSSHTRVRAHVRLSQGWHLLNEARIALVESEACWLYYQEYEPNTTEAAYWARFYLDDAVLRLYSSCGNLLKAVRHYWGLSLPPGDLLPAKVIAEAEKSSLPVLSRDIAASLRNLDTEEWTICNQYRRDWVHNDRPAIEGLTWDVLVKDRAELQIPQGVLRALGYSARPSGTLISVGTGRKITDLKRIASAAYCQLLDVYKRVVGLLT